MLRVLYLIFNEGYASTYGTELMRIDMAEEAIRMTKDLHAVLPGESEVTGLLALMLLVHARHRARRAADGSIVPLDEQDRSLWDQGAIEEGIALVSEALPSGPTGPYQLQAAIAALHDEAESVSATDWEQIVALYGVLLQVDDNPMVALNRAVAVSRSAGPLAGLQALRDLEGDTKVNNDRRFFAVRAHLLEECGRRAEAAADYEQALRRAINTQHRRYLNEQIVRLTKVATETA